MRTLFDDESSSSSVDAEPLNIWNTLLAALVHHGIGEVLQCGALSGAWVKWLSLATSCVTRCATKCIACSSDAEALLRSTVGNGLDRGCWHSDLGVVSVSAGWSRLVGGIRRVLCA